MPFGGVYANFGHLVGYPRASGMGPKGAGEVAGVPKLQARHRGGAVGRRYRPLEGGPAGQTGLGEGQNMPFGGVYADFGPLVGYPRASGMGPKGAGEVAGVPKLQARHRGGSWTWPSSSRKLASRPTPPHKEYFGRILMK